MEPDARLSAPPELPGYDILQRLGTGGTSTVWLARQISLDRVVAIKILSPRLLADRSARDQFKEEARAAAKISNSSIVSVLDFGEHDGWLFYVMEYVEGTNLSDWIHQNQRMAHGQVLKLAEIIATALDIIWREASLIHCDIKPGNILIGKDGAIKITDLGLARVVGPTSPHSISENIEGTPSYIAPEQIEGREPDCRCDIYSLGLTLYHVLTGNPPFEGRSLEDILDAQQSDYLPDPCELVPRLPVSYGWLLAKMTAKDPAKRQQSWTEVLKDIHQIKAGRSPLPPYPGDDESTILLNPRHRPSARASTLNLSIAGKKVITVSAAQSPLVSKPKRVSASAASSSRGGCLRFFLFLLFLGAVGAGIWYFAFREHPERVEQLKAIFRGAPVTPAVTPAQKAQPVEAEAPPAEPGTTEAEPPAEPEPASARTGTITPGAWNHPGFIQAATLFNDTLTAYQQHVQSPDPADSALPGLIADAQYAAVLFEILRIDAPPDVPVTLYANQCYRLGNDLRLARMTPENKKKYYTLAPKQRHPDLAPYPTPDYDPADPFAQRHAQYGYAWDTLPSPTDRPETGEFIMLLSAIAKPSADTRLQVGQYLHGPLRTFMSLADACKILRVTPEARIPIEGAPFPYGGFFQQTCVAGRLGAIGPGQPTYPYLRLITDSEDGLIAVQLFDEKPSPPLQSSPFSFSHASQIMDFVTGRVLPDKGDIRAFHNTLRGEGTLRIDSEVADFSNEANPVPLFRSVLLLPEPIANNLLYHLLGGT
ncbi:MAG: serine/threonine protein kinase [Lentisphaerae bacterium]|jgi:serine/threonine protein kinase|nr:serine/threonine protein kinase [Lentisphaerota bacterium]